MDSKIKWNSKHSDRIDSYNELVPNNRLKNLSAYLNGGSAIDLACGLGDNSFFLAESGYDVQALDISDIAVNYVKEQASKRQATVHPQLCDLTEWNKLNIKENSIDLLVITYYLDRQLFPYVKSIIKEKGYFFMETFYLSPDTKERTKVSDKYKLQPNELLSLFGEWQILFYEENEQEGRQSIFARKR